MPSLRVSVPRYKNAIWRKAACWSNSSSADTASTGTTIRNQRSAALPAVWRTQMLLTVPVTISVSICRCRSSCSRAVP